MSLWTHIKEKGLGFEPKAVLLQSPYSTTATAILSPCSTYH
jgi:hypothetical protein